MSALSMIGNILIDNEIPEFYLYWQETKERLKKSRTYNKNSLY